MTKDEFLNILEFLHQTFRYPWKVSFHWQPDFPSISIKVDCLFNRGVHSLGYVVSEEYLKNKNLENFDEYIKASILDLKNKVVLDIHKKYPEEDLTFLL